MPRIKVHSPGFLTTVQDQGRIGFSHFGISVSGASDPVSLRIGNLLVGNDQNAPALEMTLTGGSFEFEERTFIAIAGSDFQPQIDRNIISLWTTIEVMKGQVLKFSSTRSGARCYLCIQGGIDVPEIFGSSSTHLLTGMGGFQGRSLKKGDIIFFAGDTKKNIILYKLRNDISKELSERKYFRVTEAPQTDFFPDEILELFSTKPYMVTEEINRMGLRLSGSELIRSNSDNFVTEGVTLGAIQVSHNGQPIILFVEHQTTGGYPKIANVISADTHRIGQLRSGDEIRFIFVSFEEAFKQKLYLESLISENSFIKI